MSRKAICSILWLQLAVAPLGYGQSGLERLFPSRPTGYVTDVAQVVDAESNRAMSDKIQRLRNATGAEIAVVTLPTIGDYAAVDVAVAIGRAWGVGAAAEVGDPRRNAGLVILLVPRREDDPNSGQIFIATGRGLEGFITDATAGRVRDLMRPDLSRGEYGSGLRTGVDVLAAIIAQGFGVTDSTLAEGRAIYQRDAGRKTGIGMLGIVLLILLMIVLASLSEGRRGGRRYYGRRRGRRGPNIFMGGPGWGGGFGGFGGGFGGGGFGGFGGGGGFSGGGAGGRF